MFGLFALLLLPLGCGGSGGGGSSPPAEADATTQERAFLEAMVPHHRSAIEMAGQAEGKLENPELRRIRGAIAASQSAEIREMERLHKRLFGMPLRENPDAHSALGLTAGQAGMEHAAGHASLERAPPPVDRAFVDMMVPHHEGAIRMSQAVLERSGDPELRRLAERIVRDQRAEVEVMNEVNARELGRQGSGGGGTAPRHEAPGAGTAPPSHEGH